MARSFFLTFLGAWGLAVTASVAAAEDLATLQEWGLQVSGEINETLLVSGTSLYAETAWLNGTQSGGFNGRAFVWPASTQFRVLNSLVRGQPGAYTTALRQYSDELHAAYWDSGYRSGAGGGDRFYDDNAHLVIALVEAYELTGDAVYLDRATDTFEFVLEGEDSAAGGGIYFKQYDYGSKNAISTLQGARGAAMLYGVTGNPQYLDDATRLMDWSNSHIQVPSGVFYQGFDVSTNQPVGVPIVNGAGTGICANLELYEATGDNVYLVEAQRIATESVSRYFDATTGRINDEGYWAFELVDALNDLYLHDRNTLWRNKVHTAMAWLHENKEDPNGHYPLFWGRNGALLETLDSWNLNEQAAVARAFLDTSLTVLPGDVNQDGALSSADVWAFVGGWLSDTSALKNLDKMKAGDLDLSGRTDADDFSLLRKALNEAGVVFNPRALQAMHVVVPEPTALWLSCVSGVVTAATVPRRLRSTGLSLSMPSVQQLQ